METALAVLRARGIHPFADLAAEPERHAGLGLETLTAAALARTNEAGLPAAHRQGPRMAPA